MEALSAAAASEPSIASLRLSYLPGLREGQLRSDTEGNYLSNTITAANREGETAEIDKNDFDFAAVVRIDRSRRIEYHHAVLDRKTAAGPHLHLVSGRNLVSEAGWYQDPLPGRNHNLSLHGRDNVAAARSGSHSHRKRQFPGVGKPLHAD